MEVYTFSTGGCRDGFYMDRLSSTILGVGNLINDYFILNCLDREFSSIQLVGNKLLVWYRDLDTNESESLYYDLITFTVS